MRHWIVFLLYSSLLKVVHAAYGKTSDVLDFSLFDAKIEQFLEERGIEGATAAVVHRDYPDLLHERGYGNRNAKHVFQLASASKVITASVISNLHYKGTLDIRAPIRSYAPTEPVVGWWARGRMDILRDDYTLEQALSNLSGGPGLIHPLIIVYGLCLLTGGYSLKECGRFMYNWVPQLSPPGTFHRYGGPQWQVTGALAETVAEKPWSDLVTEAFSSCNMGTMGFRNEGLGMLWRMVMGCGLLCRPGEACSSCYDRSWEYNPDEPPTPNPTIEGGAYSDARSLAQVMLMILNEGELARNLVTDRQLDGDTLDASDRDIGYGMSLYHIRDEPGDVWVCPGWYASTPFIDVENGFGVVVLLESAIGSINEPSLWLIRELGQVLRDMFLNEDLADL